MILWNRIPRNMLNMPKSRVEAFSDGVIAIVITIMVLELKAPHGAELADLQPLGATFLCYVLSFVYLAIYWNNHHHLFQTVRHVTGSVLWANTHLLFWLTLIPFVTAWAGVNHFAPLPTAGYGAVLLLAAIAYFILTRTIIAAQGPHSLLARAIGADRKGKLSVLVYLLALPLALFSPLTAFTLYAVIALAWIIPDRRIEEALRNDRVHDEQS